MEEGGQNKQDIILADLEKILNEIMPNEKFREAASEQQNPSYE